jgi:DNA-binding IclR family transcriptional regulator
VALRNVVAGQRVPMELTSLGRAYLAVAPPTERRALLARFKAARHSEWRRIREEIKAAMASVEQRGYCVASWQPEVVALAAPLVMPDRPIYVFNVSVATAASVRDTEEELRGPLLALRDKAKAVLMAAEPPPSRTGGG